MGAIWVKGFKYCTGEKGDNPPPAIGQASDSSSLHIGHIKLINFSKHIYSVLLLKDHSHSDLPLVT